LPSQAVIDNTLNHGAYYVFDEGIAIPHARPECGVRQAFCLQRAGSQLYYPLPVGLHNANLNGIGLNKQFFYGHSVFLNPLEAKGFISTEYSQAVIDNTLNHGAYYVFDEGIAMVGHGG
jgi:mannitol/fructose-specific phosphotransferase system IIA component (Ntr-type)